MIITLIIILITLIIKLMEDSDGVKEKEQKLKNNAKTKIVFNTIMITFFCVVPQVNSQRL